MPPSVGDSLRRKHLPGLVVGPDEVQLIDGRGVGEDVVAVEFALISSFYNVEWTIIKGLKPLGGVRRQVATVDVVEVAKDPPLVLLKVSDCVRCWE